MDEESGRLLLDPIEGEPELERVLRDPWIRHLAQAAAVSSLMKIVASEDIDRNTSPSDVVKELDSLTSEMISRTYTAAVTFALRGILMEMPEARELMRASLVESSNEFEEHFMDGTKMSEVLENIIALYELSLLSFANNLAADNPDGV